MSVARIFQWVLAILAIGLPLSDSVGTGSEDRPNDGPKPPREVQVEAGKSEATKTKNAEENLDPPLDQRSDPEFSRQYAEVKRAVKAAVDAVRPRPLPPIPDNPPPHEGAMIDDPYVVEPPDIIRIEVLEALPGRPITGERLVRPDGTVNLDFYGEIHVRGLTLAQIKEKMIFHLREYLGDETLGLLRPGFDERHTEPKQMPALPPLPENDKNPFELDGPEPKKRPEDRKELRDGKSERDNSRTSFRRNVLPSASRTKPLRSPRSGRAGRTAQIEQGPAKPPMVVEIPGVEGRITIELHVRAQGSVPPPPAGLNPPGNREGVVWDRVGFIPPVDSRNVYIDVSAYNSKNYFVLGDVAKLGSLPWTGHETVLDAIQYASGFLNTADTNNIRLVRPARGGKPAKVYIINYEAILEKGDAKANLQLFPNDRLIIGRKGAEKKKTGTQYLPTATQSFENPLGGKPIRDRMLDE